MHSSVQDKVHGQPLSSFFGIEIFSGTGRLTASLKAIGLSDSVGIDRKLHPRLTCPTLPFDLLDSSNQDIIKSLIASPFCVYVHFAPPCGTASRARLIKRRNRYNPPIVRTDKYPNGIPNLSGSLKHRVELANQLYQVTCQLIEFCQQHQVLWSCENPGRSFMWDTTHFAATLKRLEHFETTFHHCRYGSGRRKLTKLAHVIPT